MQGSVAVLAAFVVYALGADAGPCVDTAKSKVCEKAAAVSPGWRWTGSGMEFVTSNDCGTASSISPSGLKCMASCGFCEVAPTAAVGPSVAGAVSAQVEASPAKTLATPAKTLPSPDKSLATPDKSLASPAKADSPSSSSAVCDDAGKKKVCARMSSKLENESNKCGTSTPDHKCKKSCGFCTAITTAVQELSLQTCKDQYNKRACQKLVAGKRQDGLGCQSFPLLAAHPCLKSCGLCESAEEQEAERGEEAVASPVVSTSSVKTPVTSVNTPVKTPMPVKTGPFDLSTDTMVRVAGEIENSGSGENSASEGDPHMQFADGGSADFRGHDGGIYNMLSSRAVSVNALFKDQDFLNTEGSIEFIAPGTAPHDKFIVHGTFMFETYTTVRTASGRVLNLRTKASAVGSTTVTMLEHGAPVSVIDGVKEHVIDDVTIRVREGKATIATPTWLIVSTVVQTSKAHFINLNFKQVTLDARVLPHGIIGQSYDGDGIAVDGAKDVYNSMSGGETTTAAQAEGAIEGVYTDYAMASPFATDFKFSRYNANTAPVRDVRKLSGMKTAKAQAIRRRRKLSNLLKRLNVAGAE